MSVIIPFLSAVGPELEELDIDVSDLKYLAEDVSESDLLYHTNDITATGDQITIDIPRLKKLVITSLAIVPKDKSDNNSYCYANLEYGGNVVDTVFYDYTFNNAKTKGATKGINLIGDGTRKLKINVTGFGGSDAKVLLLGFYKNTVIKIPQNVQNLKGEPQSKTSILLTWSPPVDNGGSPITEYTVQKAESADFSDGAVSGTTTSTRYTETGLDQNTTFYYRVQVSNAPSSGSISGTGVTTNTHTITVSTSSSPPDTVENVKVVQTSPTQVRLTWTTPDSGTSAIRGYQIQVQKGESTTWANQVANTRSSSTTQNITTTPNIEHRFRIKAINRDNLHSLEWSKTVSIETTIAAPSNLTLTKNTANTQVTLSWTNPALGSYTLIGLRIERSENGDLFSIIEDNTQNSNTTYIDQNIEGGRTYYYRICAITSHAISHPSDTKFIFIPARTPQAPFIHSETIGESKIKVSWTIDLDESGASLSRLEIQRSTNADLSSSTTTRITDLLSTETEITGLTAGTRYYFRMRAVNRVGNGSWSNITNSQTNPTLFPSTIRDATITSNQTLPYDLYRNLTINTGVTASVNPNTTLTVTGTLTINGTGKIKIADGSGCRGGTAGITTAGLGGRKNRHSESYSSFALWRDRGGSTYRPGTKATITSPGPENVCYDLDTIQTKFDEEPRLFYQEIAKSGGGRGSAGTEAEPSGNGGNSGSDAMWQDGSIYRSWAGGLSGSNGGQAASGVAGANGGGKILLIVNTLASNPKIEAKGNNGNNGNKGKRAIASFVGSSTVSSTYVFRAVIRNPTRGTNGSQNGTAGSKGGAGGIVCIYYRTLNSGITETTIHNAIDVSGGTGGLHGASYSSSSTYTTTRANSGSDGLILLKQV